jgi:hypothetical protein
VVGVLETTQSKWDVLAEILHIETDDFLEQKSDILFRYNDEIFLVFDMKKDKDRWNKELKKSIRKFFSKYEDDYVELDFVSKLLNIDVRPLKEKFLVEILTDEFDGTVSIPSLYQFLIKKKLFNKFVDSYSLEMIKEQFIGNGYVLPHGATILSDSWEYQDGYIIFNKNNIDYD